MLNLEFNLSMKFVTKVLFLFSISLFPKNGLFAGKLDGYFDSTYDHLAPEVKYSNTLVPPLAPKLSVYLPVTWYSLESGSNGVPFSMLSRFAFGGYISPAEMNDYQSMLSPESNRMGAIQKYGLTIFPIAGVETQKKGTLESIVLEIDDYNGAEFNQDAFRLLFQGNTSYLGQTLNVGNNLVESWRTRTLKFNFRKSFQSFEIAPTLQIGQCLNYSRIETQNMKLTTDAVGDEIQFSGSAYTANSGYSFWGSGFGLQAGLTVQLKNVYQSSKKVYSLNFGIQNLGFYNISNVNVNSRNAVWNSDNTGLIPESWNESQTFKLQAVQISSSDLQFGTWFTRQADSVKSKLNFQETTRRGTIMSPFTAFARLYITPHTYVSGVLRHEIALKYVHLVGYLPQLSYWATSRFRVTSIKGNYKFSFNYLFGLSVGGFDTYDLNAGLIFDSFKFKGKHIMTTLKFTGIESYFVPSTSHGAGFSIFLNYPLY